jgi:hypothetical protein
MDLHCLLTVIALYIIYIVLCCCVIHKPTSSKISFIHIMGRTLSAFEFFLHTVYTVLLYVSSCGEVKVKILHVHNASNFSARLLEHIDVGGHAVAIPDDYLTVNMAIYLHYSPEKNRYYHTKKAFIC